jgi:lysophospholipase L1-like esterase
MPAKKKIVFSAVIFFLMVASVEIGFRIYLMATTGLPIEGYRMYGYDRSPLVGFEMISSRPASSNKRVNTTFATNSRGFRGTREFGPKLKKEIRVAVLGDSTAFGYGATNDETTFPAMLEKKLQEKFPERPVSVINAGAPSYVAYQALAKYLTQIIDLEPDYVVTYVGWNNLTFHGGLDEKNDLIDPSYFIGKEIFFQLDHSWQAVIESYNSVLVERFKALSSAPILRSLAITLLARRLCYILLRKKPLTPHAPALAAVASTISNADNEAFYEKIVAQYSRHLGALVGAVRAQGGTPILMTITGGSGYRPSDKAHLNKALKTVSQKLNVSLVDTDEAFSASPQRASLFNPEDNYHFTDEGNRAAADLVLNKILSSTPLSPGS